MDETASASATAVVEPPTSDDTKRAAKRSPAPDVLPQSLGVAILHTDDPSTANVKMLSARLSLNTAPVTTTVEEDRSASDCAAAIGK